MLARPIISQQVRNFTRVSMQTQSLQADKLVFRTIIFQFQDLIVQDHLESMQHEKNYRKQVL